MPREGKFFEMFAEQAEVTVEASDLLLDIVNNYTEPERKVMEMNKLEHKADEITHRIAAKLNSTFITPLDQEDIHSLASAIDDIVDYIDATVERMVLYKIVKPTEDAVHLTNIIHRCVDETRTAVIALGDTKNKKRSAILKQSWIEINRLENQGDTASRSAIAKLFETESNAVEVIKWKEIYEHLETTIDKCEDVANILEQIVLKHA